MDVENKHQTTPRWLNLTSIANAKTRGGGLFKCLLVRINDTHVHGFDIH